MKKYLIEIADVVDYDKETEIDSFTVDSLDEVETEYNTLMVLKR